MERAVRNPCKMFDILFCGFCQFTHRKRLAFTRCRRSFFLFLHFLHLLCIDGMHDLLKPFIVQPEKELDLYIAGIGLSRYRNDNDTF